MNNLYIILILLVLGYGFGRRAEKKHYASILVREKKLLDLPATTAGSPVQESKPIKKSHLVLGSVVISADYFKRILAMLHLFFGGAVYSYEPLLDRAKREAILRLKESCPNADEIVNVRLETSSVFKGTRKKKHRVC